MKASILITIFCATIVSARASTVAVDPTSGEVAVSSGTGGLTLGYEFQVAVPGGITVDGLGYWDYQANGFLLNQTFDVGLWDASSAVLLRSSTITSASALQTSAHPSGDWRINPVTPLNLAPGLYRIGALIPVQGANGTVVDVATFTTAPGVTLVRFMRQIGSSTLAMPNIGPAYPEAEWFGPTFTIAPVPEPSPVVFLLASLSCVSLFSYRRSSVAASRQSAANY